MSSPRLREADIVVSGGILLREYLFIAPKVLRLDSSLVERTSDISIGMMDVMLVTRGCCQIGLLTTTVFTSLLLPIVWVTTYICLCVIVVVRRTAHLSNTVVKSMDDDVLSRCKEVHTVVQDIKKRRKT